MAISILGTIGTGTATTSTLTISHTVAAGTELLIVCAQEFGDTADTATATATYNGVSMIRAVSQGADLSGTGDGKVYIFYLKYPTTGTANMVYTCGDTTPNGEAAQCSNWAGAAMSFDPFEATNVATGSGTTPTVTVTTKRAGAVVIDSMIAQSATITVNVSQTLIAEQEGIVLGGSGGSSYELQSTPAGTVMSWAVTSSDWITSGIALRPAVDYPSFQPNRLRPAIFSPGNAR